MAIDVEAALEEFQYLKQQADKRNQEYYLLRQAVRGNFRWPRDWPAHIPRIPTNLCKPIVERFTHYLVGKPFSWNVERPNTLEYRGHAERTEKVLKRILALSEAPLQWTEGAKNGSELGRTVFKVYKKGKKGRQHAAFANIQPDYFYGIPASDESIGDYSVVYYSYPIDKLEAERIYGKRDYKTEADVQSAHRYTEMRERQVLERDPRSRRVPVTEIWTKRNYAIIVGGHVIHNDENPYKWSDTGEGFVPFVVIENIRNAGEAEGEADIQQSRVLNEHLNYLISRKAHIVNRFLVPTIVWEGAPQNYAELLSSSIGGGGAIPVRLGGKLSFLAYDRPNPAVLELEDTLRKAALESAGMNEVALQGETTGSVNTGPALQAQYQPVLSTIEKKRQAWTQGLQKLFAMLLQIQEDIGDSEVLGEAVVNRHRKSANGIVTQEGSPQAEMNPDGVLVKLSGKDINGLRTVTIHWAGVLPKDDIEQARLEMEKTTQGLQSIYSTLEKLGEEFPDDELQRIKQESNDPLLRPDIDAERTRAETPMMKAMFDAQMQQAQPPAGPSGQGGPTADPYAGELPPTEAGEDPNDLGARLKALARASQATLDDEDDEGPVVVNGQPF